jgi:hypothetical protein
MTAIASRGAGAGHPEFAQDDGSVDGGEGFPVFLVIDGKGSGRFAMVG